MTEDIRVHPRVRRFAGEAVPQLPRLRLILILWPPRRQGRNWVIWVLLLFTFWSAMSSTFFTVVSCSSVSPRPSEDVNVKFDAKAIPGNVLYQPSFRFEYGERNTSAAYDLWNKTDIKIVEWPGNITLREPGFPLLKWTNKKAKLAKFKCNGFLGMNIYGYAHEYVHLTWGPFRITTSYCPPLKIPRSLFKETSFSSSKDTEVLVSDFEFGPDSFLVIVEKRYIVRIGKLEVSYKREGFLHADRNSLSYSLATGITLEIDQLITQSCCIKEETCKNGDLVVAYNSYSADFSILVSFNGGKDFKLLPLSRPASFVTLQTLITLPVQEEVLVFYGSSENKLESQMGRFCLRTGNIKTNTNQSESSSVILKNLKGTLQSKKLGEEFSFMVWDYCRIYYSSDAGASIIPALFYFHNTIPLRPKLKSKQSKQYSILSKNCFLNESSLAYDSDSGKIGLLDSLNRFFYGIDMKSTKYFPLVANVLDMTLMKQGTENSIVPDFDLNSRPKLMYPPKYLHCNHSAVQNKEFSKRLAIKLLPKTVFPSDFMPPFYDENIPKKLQHLALYKCPTSGISIDSSITQTEQMFTNASAIKFQLEFKSFSNSTKQLHVEPVFYKDLFDVKAKLMDFAQLGLRSYYYFKYQIVVIQIASSPGIKIGDFVRLNFYTEKSLRCIHQAQQVVWIKIVENNDPLLKVRDDFVSHNDDEIKIRHMQKPETDELLNRERKTIINIQASESCGGTAYKN